MIPFFMYEASTFLEMSSVEQDTFQSCLLTPERTFPYSHVCSKDQRRRGGRSFSISSAEKRQEEGWEAEADCRRRANSDSDMLEELGQAGLYCLSTLLAETGHQYSGPSPVRLRAKG